MKDALRFYVQRDTNPEKRYASDTHRHVVKLDDSPANLRNNVDTTDEPLTRKHGEQSVWSEADIVEVEASLIAE